MEEQTNSGGGGYSLQEREARQAALTGRLAAGPEPALLAAEQMEDAAPHWQSFYRAVRQAVQGLRDL
ncbi:hypothetical protein ACFFSY_30060 [Paenibacillus aurantiacus]|uniref:Uncharacterized protein n=1 Tax=Paenibacillus aurantiacus TaxID=1936118 RepID=A0ABV5KZ48_9BACL